MGYAPRKNGKQQPITPWRGSWAHQQEQKRLEPPDTKQWPIGMRPSQATRKLISHH